MLSALCSDRRGLVCVSAPVQRGGGHARACGEDRSGVIGFAVLDSGCRMEEDRIESGLEEGRLVRS